MLPSFLNPTPQAFGQMSAERSVEFFGRLLWSSAYRHRVPPSKISISSRVNIADGGIDAEVRPNQLTEEDDLLIAGNSFFQLKAGSTAVPWQKAWMTRELLSGSAGRLSDQVERCLNDRGRYVLVCFGCDPTSKQRNVAIKHAKEIFSRFGFGKANVDVWGQSNLLSLIEPYPSIRLQLAGLSGLPFRTLDEWRLDGQMSLKLCAGSAQGQIIEKIRKCIRSEEVRHIRLVGEPGLGKTRIVLEAMSAVDLAPNVIYVANPEDFERSQLFNELMRADDRGSVILVIDDCDERHRATIWNSLRTRSHRVRLMTLGHHPENSFDAHMEVIQCPPLEVDAIKAILSDYVGQRNDLDRWAKYCSGSPRFAHAVGENLRSNPDDILRPPASVPIWTRHIHGGEQTDSAAAIQHEIVLRHVALFEKFGFEPPVDHEAKFIAELIAEVDPSITWARSQSIIKHFRDRRILQGNTTLFLVPHALHIHLWLEFWSHYGSGIKVQSILERTPNSLLKWFASMFKFGHASEKCRMRIEELLGHSGPFDEAFITQQGGAPFLNELAEAHPEAALACLERTVGRWGHERLLQFTQNRQYIVWALEKIAIWKDCFHRAAGLLLRLGAAETDTNSNNATGTFASLFGMGFSEFATSEASPQDRLNALRDAFQNTDDRAFEIASKALKTALSDHPHSKMLGPERQGMRPMPKLWAPRTWGDVHAAYRACWNEGVTQWRQQVGHRRILLAEALIESGGKLIRRRRLENDVVPILGELARASDTPLRPLIAMLSLHRRWHWQGLSRNAARSLRGLEELVRGTDLLSHIKRYVLLGCWDDQDRGKDGHFGEQHTRLLKRLARQAIADDSVLRSLLPLLSSDKGTYSHHFGFWIGMFDVKGRLWPEILSAFEEASPRVSEVLCGYLCAVFNRSIDEWEQRASEVLDRGSLGSQRGAMILASGVTQQILLSLRNAVELTDLADETFQNFAFARQDGSISIDTVIEFLDWCARLDRPKLIESALTTAHKRFCFEKQPHLMPEEPTFSILTSAHAFKEGDQSRYTWAETADAYIKKYPHRSINLLENILSRFEDHAFVLRLEHSYVHSTLLNLIKSEPRGAWNVVSRYLENDSRGVAWHVAHWLGPRFSFGGESVFGPLTLFDPTDVLAWVSHDVENRAHLIARECPKTFDATSGQLTREMMKRYGHRDDVRGALSANFGTCGFMGSAAEFYRAKREKLRAWLGNEHEPKIIGWLQTAISGLNEDVRRSEIHEEREFEH